MSTILWSFGIWSKLERWKGSISELTTNQKKHINLNCCLLLFYTTTTNHFSTRLWHAMKSGFYMTTSSVAGLRKKLQSTFKSQTCTKKGHGHCLVVWCLSDPLQLSESQWNHYIWEVYSANWWDAPKTATSAASISQQNGPSSSPWCWTMHHTTNASKVEHIGLWSFASFTIFSWPLANQLALH